MLRERAVRKDRNDFSVTKGKLWGDCELCGRSVMLDTLEKHHGFCSDKCETKYYKKYGV